ncbi:hypothetical protein B0H66DRAFT_595598 [Apodospora peruviana]|uniref:Uncharacterized protein n=1 Tax=Apodospora peruviana TaxID=516989 RepID=A0AAE0HUH7_9PEZI|nr:hypothetical protein B0H66DRAFT_595598 [Apodospora peruviana]
MAHGSVVLIPTIILSQINLFAARAQTVEIKWSTDMTGPNSTFGPDGPWQALMVELNNRTNGQQEDHPFTVAMWPTNTNTNIVLATEGGGTFPLNGDAHNHITAAYYDDPWMSDLFSGYFRRQDGTQVSINDKVWLPNPRQGPSLSIDTSFAALFYWKTRAPDGRYYTPLVGKLSLAAEYLPVSWDEGLKYYLWDVRNANYARIIASPSYLGFVLGPVNTTGTATTNLTIKVPFKLLNLTLEPPIVDTPTPYFPCMSRSRDSDVSQLGRAFLQAAFFGINHDQSLLFLAQAPGPKMGPSSLRTLQPSDRFIVAGNNSLDAFADSWNAEWVVLGTPNEPATSTSILVADATSSGSSTTPSGSLSGSFGTEQLVGTLSGVTVGVILAAVVAVTWKPEKAVGGEDAPKSLGKSDGADKKWTVWDAKVQEMGDPLPHELEAPIQIHEAPDDIPQAVGVLAVREHPERILILNF